MQRRSFLQGIAAGGAVLSVSPSSSASTESGVAQVWPLFDPLGAGSEIGLGWSLYALSEARRGALVLTLQHVSGRRADVHLCRKGHEARGMAQTRDLDLMLMNDGDGSRPTDENLGRVIKTLARLIDKNAASVPSGLLAHEQRINAHGPRRILE